MLPKELRIIENRRWRVTDADYYSRGDFPGVADTSNGWYWIVCVDRPADIRRLSISGWAHYPTEKNQKN
jgi:hypothetical protein